MVKISLREIVMDVPVQEVIARDNVSVKVNAVLYFRVLHPEKSVIQVENYLYGTSQLAQTTLRSVCGQAELDELLAERDAINRRLDREKLQERLAKLAGGVAVLKVGAATETERNEKEARVEDALHATRAAVEEGIVPGGDVALLRAQHTLNGLEESLPEDQ